MDVSPKVFTAVQLRIPVFWGCDVALPGVWFSSFQRNIIFEVKVIDLLLLNVFLQTCLKPLTQ